MVAALGTVLAVAVGICFYGVSVYLAALSHGPRAFSLTTVSIATGAFLLVAGVSGLGVAGLLARIDPRWVICAGAFLAGGALLALGHVRSPAQLLGAYAGLGVGFAATSTIPASTLIAQWFPRRRVLALSLTFTGLPLGGAVLTPPIAALVHAVGVTGAAPWLAGAYVVGIVPLTLAFVRPGPSFREETAAADGESPPAEQPDGTPGQAVRAGWFWAVTVAFMLGMLGQIGALSHLFNSVTERLDAGAGALAVSTMAAASLAGRVLGSWALERVDLSLATVALLAVQAVATLGLGVAPSAGATLACTAVFGVTVGNMQVLHPLVIATRYGGRHYGRVLATSNLGVTMGMAVGPLLVGIIRAGTGSYPWGIAAAAVCAGTGAVVFGAVLGAARVRAGVPLAATAGNT